MLKVAFGEAILNKAVTPQGKVLFDHEQTVKDVCGLCNSDLSIFDNAGARLVTELNQHFDLTARRVPFDETIFSWILKTHLNCIRIIPDKRTGQPFAIRKDLFAHLVNHQPARRELFRFYIEGWQGADYLWMPETGMHIQYFAYKSVQTMSQKILISNLRLKALDTFLLLPTNNNYQNFAERCESVVDELSSLNFNLQPVDVDSCVAAREIEVRNILSLADVTKIIQKR